jgi:hypothetical protein
MFESSNGKLFVYASSFCCDHERLKPVSAAAEKMAKWLGMNFEIKTFRKRFTPIYVYYEDGDEEPIPIYCSNRSQADVHEICTSLRNMMFVLSFHPKHSCLRQIRKEIMLFS